MLLSRSGSSLAKASKADAEGLALDLGLTVFEKAEEKRITALTDPAQYLNDRKAASKGVSTMAFSVYEVFYKKYKDSGYPLEVCDARAKEVAKSVAEKEIHFIQMEYPNLSNTEVAGAVTKTHARTRMKNIKSKASRVVTLAKGGSRRGSGSGL
jgi:hypothetical protein